MRAPSSSKSIQSPSRFPARYVPATTRVLFAGATNATVESAPQPVTEELGALVAAELPFPRALGVLADVSLGADRTVAIARDDRGTAYVVEHEGPFSHVEALDLGKATVDARIADLDGDGIADVMLRWVDGKQPAAHEVLRRGARVDSFPESAVPLAVEALGTRDVDDAVQHVRTRPPAFDPGVTQGCRALRALGGSAPSTLQVVTFDGPGNPAIPKTVPTGAARSKAVRQALSNVCSEGVLECEDGLCRDHDGLSSYFVFRRIAGGVRVNLIAVYTGTDEASVFRGAFAWQKEHAPLLSRCRAECCDARLCARRSMASRCTPRREPAPTTRPVARPCSVTSCVHPLRKSASRTSPAASCASRSSVRTKMGRSRSR